jgi:hypothetical protein
MDPRRASDDHGRAGGRRWPAWLSGRRAGYLLIGLGLALCLVPDSSPINPNDLCSYNPAGLYRFLHPIFVFDNQCGWQKQDYLYLVALILIGFGALRTSWANLAETRGGRALSEVFRRGTEEADYDGPDDPVFGRTELEQPFDRALDRSSGAFGRTELEQPFRPSLTRGNGAFGRAPTQTSDALDRAELGQSLGRMPNRPRALSPRDGFAFDDADGAPRQGTPKRRRFGRLSRLLLSRRSRS